MAYQLSEYTAEYVAENYKALRLYVRAEDAEKIKAAASAAGKSLNGFIGGLIADAVPGVTPLDRQGGKSKKG